MTWLTSIYEAIIFLFRLHPADGAIAIVMALIISSFFSGIGRDRNSQKIMMKKCIKYFKNREWSTLNSQCPECYGGKPGKVWGADTVGHTKNCILANCLKELGQKVVWKMKNRGEED